MAISFYKKPTEIIFSGNPVTIGIKDTAALTGNVESRCVLLLKFLQGFTRQTTFIIKYNSKDYTYQFPANFPYKQADESLDEWVKRLVLILLSIKDLEEMFYIRTGGVNQIVMVEKEIKGNITITGSIYQVATNLNAYLTLTTSTSNSKISKSGFHAIGIQIRETIDFGMRVAGAVLSEFPVDYGSALEIASSVYYTSESFLEKVTDGSLSVEENISSLLKFKKRGHFDIDEQVVIYDLAKKFSVYAYILKGTPPVKYTGSECNIFRVIDAEITRTRQAMLNETGRSIYDYLKFSQSFMTWAPNNKVVDVYYPEILYFVFPNAQNNYSYCAREYYDDDTDTSYTVAEFTAAKYQVGMFSAALLKIKSPSAKRRIKYEVWIEHDGAAISEVRTYILSYKYEPYARYWIFKNGFGVYEVLRTTGKAQSAEKLEKSFIEISVPDEYTLADRDKEQSYSTRQPGMVLGTGPLNEVWAKYYLELFDSEDAYLLQKGRAIPANILADEFVYKNDGENISPHTIHAELTGIDEDKSDTSITLPIEGDYYKEDFDESFLIGNI